MKIATFPVGMMQANCYFLMADDSPDTVVVDPGDEAGRISEKLAERGRTVRWIFLTHVHFDHMMALEALREKTGAPLAVCSPDAEALLHPEYSLMKQYAGIDAPCRPADRLLQDGDEITLSNEVIRVLHTPGHTKGSCCFLTGNSLITGDTLFRGNIGRHDFYGGDYLALMKSLQRLAMLEGDYRVYPGHGASTTLSRERAENPYLQLP